MEDVYRHIEEHLEESLADLARLCALPSVSAQGQAIQETAEFVASLLEGAGFRTRLLPKPGGGHPVVYGELEGASPKTLVFYNHYDVQPPEPLELWRSPPFQLTRRDDRALRPRRLRRQGGHRLPPGRPAGPPGRAGEGAS